MYPANAHRTQIRGASDREERREEQQPANFRAHGHRTALPVSENRSFVVQTRLLSMQAAERVKEAAKHAGSRFARGPMPALAARRQSGTRWGHAAF